MASARQIGDNATVHTFGSSGMGRDYTSIIAWETATQLDLVTLSQSRHLACYNDAVYTTHVTILGAVTNGTYYRSVGVAAGEGHDGTPNTGVRFTEGGSEARTFRVSEDNVRLNDLVVSNTAASLGSTGAIVFISGSGRVAGCIAHDVDNGLTGTGRGIDVNSTTGAVEIIDCIMINNETQGLTAGGSNAVTVSNCTAANNGGTGFNRSGSALFTATNCLADGNSTDFAGTFEAASTTNASSDATAVGTSPRVSQTFTFEGAGGDDYHLSLSDTGALGFGTDLSADFDDDIDGTTVTQWSIGAHSPAFSTPSAGGASLRRRRRNFR